MKKLLKKTPPPPKKISIKWASKEIALHPPSCQHENTHTNATPLPSPLHPHKRIPKTQQYVAKWFSTLDILPLVPLNRAIYLSTTSNWVPLQAIYLSPCFLPWPT